MQLWSTSFTYIQHLVDSVDSGRPLSTFEWFGQEKTKFNGSSYIVACNVASGADEVMYYRRPYHNRDGATTLEIVRPNYVLDNNMNSQKLGFQTFQTRLSRPCSNLLLDASPGNARAEEETGLHGFPSPIERSASKDCIMPLIESICGAWNELPESAQCNLQPWVELCSLS